MGASAIDAGVPVDLTNSAGDTLLVLAAFAVVTLACALLFPDRPEELRPELWARSLPHEPAPAPAE